MNPMTTFSPSIHYRSHQCPQSNQCPGIRVTPWLPLPFCKVNTIIKFNLALDSEEVRERGENERNFMNEDCLHE